jgi:hypothetical protein
MKTITALLALLLAAPAAASAQRLQLDSLDRLASRAAEVVDITIDPEMLKIAGAFLRSGREQEQVKQLLSELRGVYVRVYEFDQDESYSADLDAVRRQLTSSRWSRLVNVDSRRDRELVEIYTWRDGDATGGWAIITAQPRELSVINIVGPIDLAKLGALQGVLGIPRLPEVR